MNRTGFITLSGTREGIRTPDLLVRSQTLYPTELLALIIRRFVKVKTSQHLLSYQKKIYFQVFYKIFFNWQYH